MDGWMDSWINEWMTDIWIYGWRVGSVVEWIDV
jgi:hypothetical protein